METPVFAGRISERATLQLSAHDRRGYDMWLATLTGEDVEVVIRKRRQKRSNAQNRRYWALLTVGAASLWGSSEDTESLHEEIAHLLLALPACPKTGLRRRMRTPKLNTAEFGQYMDLVAMKLVELGADLTGWDDEVEKQTRAA